MNCPSCWRPIQFEEKYTRILSCNYCNTVLEFWRWELTKIWEQSEIIEFPSIFNVWKETQWNWKIIYVKWQLRYEYDWWFFDKFFVLIDWKQFHIKEDDWMITLTKEWNWQTSEESLLNKEPWINYNILWKDYFIQEVWTLKLVNIKWFVDKPLIPWKDYEYLDAIKDWKMYFLEKEIWTGKIRINEEVKI